MRIEDLKSWTVDQLKEEVVRLSDECEEKQHKILNLKDNIEIIARKNKCLEEKISNHIIKGSFLLHALHPDIAKDTFLREKLQECVDYIYDNYDMEKFTKI